MSDTATTPDGTQPSTDDAGGNADNIKALRNAAEQGRTAQAENLQLRKEMLFVKAGVDTETKLGKLLLQTWDGDPADVDALKAEWAELNPGTAQGQTTTAPPETAPTPEGFQNPAGQQEHRENATNGQPAGSAPPATPDPVDAAFQAFWAGASTGRPLEDRQVDALGTFVQAFYGGDSRTRFDPQAWAQKQIMDSASDLA